MIKQGNRCLLLKYDWHNAVVTFVSTTRLNKINFTEQTLTSAFVPSQRKKRHIDGLSSWNVSLPSTLSLFPHFASDLLIYQAQICKLSRKFKASALKASAFMYDTTFRYMADSNVYVAWGKVNEQLYNYILKETLPYCIHWHTYGQFITMHNSNVVTIATI